MDDPPTGQVIIRTSANRPLFLPLKSPAISSTGRAKLANSFRFRSDIAICGWRRALMTFEHHPPEKQELRPPKIFPLPFFAAVGQIEVLFIAPQLVAPHTPST